jgi:hypothetical protein
MKNQEKGIIDIFNGALLIKQDLFVTLRSSPLLVQKGFMIVLLVGLLVGGIDGIRTMMSTLNPERDFARLQEELEASINQQAMNAQTPEQRMILGAISENIESGVALLRDVTLLPTPLPNAVGAVFRGLGVVVSRPLGYLSSLLLAVVCIHIAAGWLGGRGSIQQMLGLGALSVAPRALDALHFVPVLGSALGFLSLAWSVVILIIATSVAHELESGRATFAVFLFPLIGALIGLLACCGLFFLGVIAAGGA